MKFTASQIAALINGKIEGDANALVESFGKIEEATAGQLAFLANPKYEEYLYHTKASVIIVNQTQALKKPVHATLIRVPDAYDSFATILLKYQEYTIQQLEGIQQPIYISKTAKHGNKIFIGAFTYVGDEVSIGDNTKIFPNSYLGDQVKIGNNCILHAGVKVYKDCIIGSHVIIHAGTVIGSDGFGFVPQADGSFKKIPQLGNVVIEDNVEIGANTTIDRATMGSTIIRAGAKIDNLVQVAHNVEIGENTAIAAQAGISGSVKIGSGSLIGGQVGIAGHLNIGDQVKIGAQSGILKSIENGRMVWGSPAFDHSAALRSLAIFRVLPQLEKRVRELEALLKEKKVK